MIDVFIFLICDTNIRYFFKFITIYIKKNNYGNKKNNFE
jgi:hypothetical protein